MRRGRQRWRRCGQGTRLLVLLAVVWALGVLPATADHNLRLQLSDDHQFQFAGYYAALWKGYYAAAGLQVELVPGLTADGRRLQPLAELAGRQADFAVAGAEVLPALAQGQDLVILASIFQDSTQAFYALEKTPLSSPADLKRLRVASPPESAAGLELQVLLYQQDLAPAALPVAATSPTIDDLLNGVVDVCPGNILDFPLRLAEAGHAVRVLRPSRFEVRFYGEGLVTRRTLLHRDPELVARFRAASLRGWHYALDHPDEIADRIARELTRVQPVADPQGFNRKMIPTVNELVDHPRIDIGHLSRDRWQSMADSLQAAGLLDGSLQMENYLYVPERDQPDFIREHRGTFGAGVAAALLLLASLHILHLRRSVARATAVVHRQRQDLEEKTAVLEQGVGRLPIGFALSRLSTGAALYLNPVFLHLYGLPEQGVDGVKTFFERAYPDTDQRRQIRQWMAEGIASGDPDKLHWENLSIINPQVKNRLVDAQIIPLPEQDLLICLAWDVTERERVRRDVLRLEQRYGRLFDSAGVAQFEEDLTAVVAALDALRREGVADLDAYLREQPEEVIRLVNLVRVVDVNDAAARLFAARHRGELLQGILHTFLPETLDAARLLLVALWRGDRSFDAETPYVTLTGDTVWALLSLPLPATVDEARSVPITLVDVTERHRAEAANRQAQLRYQHLFQNAGVAIWEWDCSGLKPALAHLRERGVDDLPDYLQRHPDERHRLLHLVRGGEANTAALDILGATSQADFENRQGILWRSLLSKAFPEMAQVLLAGEGTCSVEHSGQRLDEQTIVLRLIFNAPGWEEEWSPIPVCLIDMTLFRRIQQEREESRQRYKFLLESAPIALCEEDFAPLLELFIRLRRQGVVDLRSYLRKHPEAVEAVKDAMQLRVANPAALQLFGVTDAGSLMAQRSQLASGEALVAYLKVVEDLWEGRRNFQYEFPCPSVDGRALYLRVSGVFPAEGTRLTVSFEDLTALRQKELVLKKMSMAMEQMSAMVVITDVHGAIEYVNPAFEQMTGYSLEEVRGQTPQVLKSGFTAKQVYKDLWQTLKAGKVWHGELYNRKKNGDYFWEYDTISPLIDDHGQVTHFIAVKEDITRLKEQEMQLMLQAHYDELTGLPNRVLAIDRLGQAMRKVHRAGKSVGVFFLDLDHFKDINDSLGHDFGDHFLVEVAGRIKEAVRQSDTVARLGGDEFLVIAEGVASAEDARQIGDKIIQAFTHPFDIDGREVATSCSIGIARSPEDGDHVSTLLKAADAAMYQAKALGRNQVQLFSAELNLQATERFELETRLRHALERKELSLVYQPQLDSRSGRCVGVEALLRWQPEGLAAVTPSRFIPLAEEIGAILPIGNWVAATACRQLAAWVQRFSQPLQMSINVSPRQFHDPEFLPRLKGHLETHQLPPHLLVVEVTEGLLVEDFRHVRDCLQGLKKLGLSLSADDFGTGYASLSYLRKFPFDMVKIDRSFIVDLERRGESAALVKAIIAMAKELKLTVVGEGVETEPQRKLLSAMGCDVLQGYLLGRPLSPDAFEAFLAENLEGASVSTPLTSVEKTL